MGQKLIDDLLSKIECCTRRFKCPVGYVECYVRRFCGPNIYTSRWKRPITLLALPSSTKMRRTTLPSSIGYVFEMLSEAYNYCIATSIPIFNATLPRKGDRSRHPLNTPYVPLFESTHPTKRLSDDVFDMCKICWRPVSQNHSIKAKVESVRKS
jgi:hypothetical protein